MNAASSGQSGNCCQKNESPGRVMAKPSKRPNIPAGIISRWTLMRPKAKRKTVCVARKSASSARKTIPAIVIRYRAILLRLRYVLKFTGSGKRDAKANVVMPNANIFDSVREA